MNQGGSALTAEKGQWAMLPSLGPYGFALTFCHLIAYIITSNYSFQEAESSFDFLSFICLETEPG